MLSQPRPRQSFNRIADNSWIAPLTRDMPKDIRWTIKNFNNTRNMHGSDGYWLFGEWRGRVVFDRLEYIDWKSGHPTGGSFNVEGEESGYRGLGLLYMRNAMAFLSERFNVDKMKILAGSYSGARIWALAGFDMVSGEHSDHLAGKLRKRVPPLLTKTEAARLNRLIGRIGNRDNHALRELANCMDIDLAERKWSDLHPLDRERDKIMEALKAHYKGRIPLAAFMLYEHAWNGEFRIGDPVQSALLDKAIAARAITRRPAYA